MNYELAKELKDAGFPQKVWSGSLVWDGDNWIVASAMKEIKLATALVCPTLSELIEASGNHFYFELRHVVKPTAHLWMADFQRDAGAIIQCGEGLTPEEAVARLYLALYNGRNGKTNKGSEPDKLHINPLVPEKVQEGDVRGMQDEGQDTAS